MIISSKIKQQKLKMQGFSLIELLISSAIFVTISVIIVTALFVTFRVSRKTEIIRSLRQSGDTAMTQMVNQIRYAANLDDPDSCVPSATQSEITFTSSSDGGRTTLSCPTETSAAIASNGASLIDTSRFVVATCSFKCTQAIVTDKPTITIDYALYPATSSALSETQGQVTFRTSVTMRNYQK